MKFSKRSRTPLLRLVPGRAAQRSTGRRIAGILKFAGVTTAVLTVLMSTIYIESYLEDAARRLDLPAEVDNEADIESEGQRFAKSLKEDFYKLTTHPLGSIGLLVKDLQESGLLQLLEGVSLVTAITLFIVQGHREEKRQAHYMAWSMIDGADGKETSYARIEALQDLNQDGVSLKGLDAVKADLAGIDLGLAELYRCKLNEANLLEAELTGIRADFSEFNNAELKGAVLKQAKLWGSEFRSTSLNYADLTGAELRHANFEDAEFNNANLGDANLSDANLRRAELRHADLHCANLKGVDLTDADLDKANLSGSQNLTCRQVKSARNWQHSMYDDTFKRKLFGC